MDQLRGTAFHEAGHVVGYLYFGQRFLSVRLNPDGTGQVTPDGGFALRDFADGRRNGSVPRSALEAEIVINYAGPAAEARVLDTDLEMEGIVLPDNLPPSYFFGHHNDLEEIKYLISCEPTWRKPFAHQERLLRKAKWLIRMNWSIVEAVAERLVERGELTYDECNNLWPSWQR